MSYNGLWGGALTTLKYTIIPSLHGGNKVDLAEITDLEQRLVRSVKRNCLLCHARRAFERPANPEREIVLASLDALTGAFENKYNLLRKNNSTPQKIQAALASKRISLDAIDMCRGCDREVDRANRAMLLLK